MAPKKTKAPEIPGSYGEICMATTIRTRFAPSPTGFLHVGGLRTALYNYLFARNQKGRFILRIEDTDRSRLVEDAVENLISTLKRMGIEYDEGPDKGGNFGPYIQSQRIGMYREHAEQLVESGDAYYCFCTPERLKEVRAQQERLNQQPKYDGHCRNLSPGEVKEKLNQGLPHVVRLKMPLTGETVFRDLIRGEVQVQNELTDDQVLLKSDGYPTYHLANVIDDHYMQISHVIRGEEWLLSVPKHIRLYQAFGWEIPQMAHLPLLLNPDRSKLSKRQGDVAVEDFLEKGYLPEALNNFVALLGWNPGTDQEFFSLKELTRLFSLERVNKAGAVFDLKKLNWMNGHYIRELPEERLFSFLTPFLQKAGYSVSDREKTRKIILAVYKNISRGEELPEKAAIFYRDTIEISNANARAVLAKSTSRTVVQTFLAKIKPQESLDLNSFSAIMKEIQNETGIKKQDLWMPVRVALTGYTHGPELPIVIEVLGKEKIQNFVEQVISKFYSD